MALTLIDTLYGTASGFSGNLNTVGADLVVCTTVDGLGGGSFGTPTVGGASMTLERAYTAGFSDVYGWYKVNPTQGASVACVLKCTDAHGLGTVFCSFSGADVSDPIYETAVMNDNSSGLSITVTFTGLPVGCMLVGSWAQDPYGGGTMTFGSSLATSVIDSTYYGAYKPNGYATEGLTTWTVTRSGANIRYRSHMSMVVKPASGIPGVKDMNTVANADIKTINGIAVADIKSVQGLA